MLWLSGFALGAEEVTPDARKAWASSGKTLAEILELEELREELPESKWLGRDQKDVDREVGRLIEELVDVLRVNGLGAAREEMLKLEMLEEKRRSELRAVREKSALAPQDVSVLEFYKKDREAFQKEAVALEEEIATIREAQDVLLDDMLRTARASGLEVDERQMTFLLHTVSGSDLLDLSAVFQNVRELNQLLEGLVREDPEDTEAARRYYGIHVVLLRTLRQAHEDVLDRLDTRYLPRVEELTLENEALQEETKKLLRFAEPSQRELLRSSRDTQRVTEQALEVYEDYLRSIRDRVYEARKELQQRIDVAWNAYQTIRIAATLADEMSAAVQDLQTLRSLEVPDLLPLQEEALQQKFLELSEQLRE